jgi:TolB-like protein/DNA-binding winged helix-turn-helix (wHTH) protein/Flp pilus assembly protein TadD
MKSGEFYFGAAERDVNDAEMDTLYEFDGFVLDPARRLLTRGGEAVAITAKSLDALVHLVERAGQTVQRTALAEALWPRVVVEDNNLSQTILALRRALGESEGGPRYIVTLPKQGYRFVAHVVKRARSERAPDNAQQPTKPPATGQSGGTPRRQIALVALASAGAIALAVVALIAWNSTRRHALPATTASTTASSGVGRMEAPRPKSIAVLPFRNLSPDAQDAYFAEGIHEEVLTRLAKVKGLSVIGRTSVMQYADAATPFPTIANALHVATILEGSVRYAADRVRVTVRLVDSSSGAELWSEVYDAELKDVFGIQSDLATRIASELTAELGELEGVQPRIVPTTSAQAYALYLRAIALYRANGGIGVSMSRQTRQMMTALLDEALSLDADFADALGWKAHTDLDSLFFDSAAEGEWAARSAQLMARAERNAQRALARDPALGVAHTTLARLNIFRWRIDEARASLERAVRSNPNDSVVLHYSAMVHWMLDEHAEAIRAARRALELDPRNPAPYSPLVLSLHASGENATAIQMARELIEVAPTAALGYVVLARTLTQSGDFAGVRETLRLGEPFLDGMRNFRVDAALSYARAGAPADAERLVQAFRQSTKARHVDAGLDAMAHLALGNYQLARDRIESVISQREAAIDPLPLLLIRQNIWSDPILDSAEWVRLRKQLAWQGG